MVNKAAEEEEGGERDNKKDVERLMDLLVTFGLNADTSLVDSVDLVDTSTTVATGNLTNKKASIQFHFPLNDSFCPLELGERVTKLHSNATGSGSKSKTPIMLCGCAIKINYSH